MSTVSYVSGLWKRCVAAAQSIAGARDRPAGSGGPFAASDGGDAGDPALLVYGQALWMAVTLALLYALALLSGQLYFLVSFIGLLCNRLLFAPRTEAAGWWRLVNAVTWLCFAVFCYVVALRLGPG